MSWFGGRAAGGRLILMRENAMAGTGRSWLLGVLAVAGVLAASGFATGPSAASGDAGSLAGGAGTAASGAWGKALTLGGLAKSGYSSVTAISCSSAGNCSAVGSYRGGQVFTVSQVRGTWGKPEVIPGLAQTSKPSSSASGLRCFSTGGCVLIGSYTDAAGHAQAFIASKVRGTWHKIIWVPGLARLNRGNHAGLDEFSCPSAGNCTAVGSYTDGEGAGHQFVVSQARGTWGTARPVPQLTGLPGETPGTTAGFGPISCASAGNCAVGGSYAVSGGNQVYLEDEVHGTWGTPEAVPGLAVLNTGLGDEISFVSCPSAGNCTAAGFYTETEGNSDSFVVSETRGTWGTAIEVATSIPGFNGPDGDWITALSCPSAGNCVAGGVDNVERDALASQVFIVTQVHGTWGKAIPVPGTTKINQGDQAWLNQISCSSAGNCGIAGYFSVAYDYGFVYTQPFVVNQVHGTWGKAIEVPGIKPLPLSDGQSAGTTTIACSAPDRCSAGGYRDYASTGIEGNAFVDSQS